MNKEKQHSEAAHKATRNAAWDLSKKQDGDMTAENTHHSNCAQEIEIRIHVAMPRTESATTSGQRQIFLD